MKLLEELVKVRAAASDDGNPVEYTGSAHIWIVLDFQQDMIKN